MNRFKFSGHEDGRVWLSVGFVVAVSFSGCQAKPSVPSESKVTITQPAEVPVPVRVAPVVVRSVERRVSVVGSLFGFERITVTPKVEGRIEATYYDVGDRVEPNATLLELDRTDYQLAVEEAQRALEHELARLDLVKPPSPDFEIDKLPMVERARLLVVGARRNFARQEKLAATNVAIQQDYEQAETDLRVAEATSRQARMEARTTLAAVRHRESVLSLARQKLSETKVNAPNLVRNSSSPAGQAANFVVTKRLASVGEMVRAFPSTPVYELVVDDVLKLKVMVPERYMSQVTTGLAVETRVEAYPRELFLGRVARINPTVDPQSRSFEVEAHIPNSDHRLRHGGFAKADVILASDEGALTIPLEAVTRFAGVSKVFRVRDNLAEEVEIEIGVQGEGWVEALGGLQSGDLIVTSGQSKLANRTRVEIHEPETEQAEPKPSDGSPQP